MSHTANHTAFIALGSNLARPEMQIRRAISVLGEQASCKVSAVSALYLTAPVGYADQPDFVNAVLRMETALHPMVLLRLLNRIEADFGRERSFQNAPRTLDLDLIAYDEQVWYTERLLLPHPRAYERAFVLMPLADIAPDFMLGQHGRVVDLLARTEQSGIVRLRDAELPQEPNSEAAQAQALLQDA